MPTAWNQVIEENEFLAWESCADDRFPWDCPPPRPMRNFLPDWFRGLSGNLREYLPEGFGADHTIRHCLGFRGLLDLGYTIPLPEPVGGAQTHFSSGNLHPEMVHGTQWAEAPGGPWPDPSGQPHGLDFSAYRYRIKLLFWPWRARMAPGWRMVILPNPWEWNPHWQSFAGAPRPNYQFNHEHTGLGNYNRWEIPIRPGYNYLNIENVLAVERSYIIPAGTVTFWALPIYDPENC